MARRKTNKYVSNRRDVTSGSYFDVQWGYAMPYEEAYKVYGKPPRIRNRFDFGGDLGTNNYRQIPTWKDNLLPTAKENKVGQFNVDKTFDVSPNQRVKTNNNLRWGPKNSHSGFRNNQHQINENYNNIRIQPSKKVTFEPIYEFKAKPEDIGMQPLKQKVNPPSMPIEMEIRQPSLDETIRHNLELKYESIDKQELKRKLEIPPREQLKEEPENMVFITQNPKKTRI